MRRDKLYCLNQDGEPYRVNDIDTWIRRDPFHHPKRVVKQERIGKATISTVFLTINHNFTGKGPPVLWETMVFGGKHDQACYRCAGSREQAAAQHDRIVEMVKAG